MDDEDEVDPAADMAMFVDDETTEYVASSRLPFEPAISPSIPDRESDTQEVENMLFFPSARRFPE